MPPIVRTIAPANNGQVPAGAPVTVSAVLVGRGSDLASATLQIDGADAGAQIDKRTSREWTIRATRPLDPGSHTARVQVRDASGAPGGFTWRFTVGDDTSENPTPAPKPKP
jgi:outer membrane lipoprotein SlyB